MMKGLLRRKEQHFLAAVFLFSGMLLLLFSLPGNITGNAVGVGEQVFTSQNISFPIIGLVFLFVSFLFMTQRKDSLEAIIVPTAPTPKLADQRARAGAKLYAQRPGSKVIITGVLNGTSEGKLLSSQTSEIYRKLRKNGVPRADIEIEGQSEDTTQNILYVSDRLKEEDIHYVTLVTDRDHARRMSMLFRRAREVGIAPRDLEIRTHSKGIDESYGSLKAQIAYAKDFALPLKGGKDKPKGIKEVAKRIFGQWS